MFNKWRLPPQAARSHQGRRNAHTYTSIDFSPLTSAKSSAAAALGFTSESSIFRCTYISPASCRGRRVRPAPRGRYWNEMEMYDAESSLKQVNEQSLQLRAAMLTATDLIRLGGHCMMPFVCLCGLFWINEADCESAYNIQTCIFYHSATLWKYLLYITPLRQLDNTCNLL